MKVVTDIVEGRYFEKTQAKKRTYDDMVAKYLEKYEKPRDKYSLKKLDAYFKGYTLHEIIKPDLDLIAGYKDKRDKVVKPATVYQELALLRKIFNIAQKQWKWIKENPVSCVPFAVGNKNRRDRWLTIEQERELLDKATNPRWLRPLLIVAFQTGMRRGEILNLSWPDIDFQRNTILVVKSKNGEQRTIPMSNLLADTLKGIKVRSISGKVFPVSVSTLRDAFKDVLAKTDITDFHFHDCRHTFATRLVQAGEDIYKVSKLLGHKSITMTDRYVHHCTESLQTSVTVLNECYKSVTMAGVGN